MTIWIGFFICGAAILYSGIKLSKYGDIIAEKTGLGRTWIGVVLMASVTSLPELVTGISSVTYADVPNIAVGDILGSCAFNISILGFVDLIDRKKPIASRAHHGHVLSAGFGILLLSVAGIGLFLGKRIPPLGWIGPYTLVFLAGYFAAIRIIYIYEKRQIAEYVKDMAVELKYEAVSTRSAVAAYGFNAAIVISAAVFLPKLGEAIAVQTGLGQTFVGNMFIAVSTSLPEVVVTISAARMDAIDLAIGNLFGSNIFNICILAIDDLVFVRGPILSFASTSHLIPTLSAIAMTSLAIIGLTHRAEKKPFLLAWDSAGILLIQLINFMLLYSLR